MELPSDVLVSIVLRLPPSSRRLTRLVCRQWRDVVDTRTAEMQSRAKPLVTTPSGSAYFASNLSTGSPGRYLWKNNTASYRGIMVVGTCNGLICLCDNRETGGAITLLNPVTAERLPLPRLPRHATVRDFTIRSHARYGFAYHPTTGRHKVVHVGDYGRKGSPQVKVFTLGEASWRDVTTAPGPRCDYGARIVGVDGTMYWAAKRGKKLMAFDLDCERLTFIKSLPDVSSGSWHLAAVLGRLGILFFHERIKKWEVWALEGASTIKEHKWSWLYRVGWGLPPHSSPIACHLTRDVVNKHELSSDNGVAETSKKRGGMLILSKRAFAYVETTEPLNVYRCWS